MGDVRSAIFSTYQVSCSFLVPEVNFSQDVNLTTVQPGFTVLPRTTGQPYQSRSHARLIDHCSALYNNRNAGIAAPSPDLSHLTINTGSINPIDRLLLSSLQQSKCGNRGSFT